jgi:hypothetical protein
VLQFNNAGSVIVDVAAGAIQDTTPGGGYNGVIAFFIVRGRARARLMPAAGVDRFDRP